MIAERNGEDGWFAMFCLVDHPHDGWAKEYMLVGNFTECNLLGCVKCEMKLIGKLKYDSKGCVSQILCGCGEFWYLELLMTNDITELASEKS